MRTFTLKNKTVLQIRDLSKANREAVVFSDFVIGEKKNAGADAFEIGMEMQRRCDAVLNLSIARVGQDATQEARAKILEKMDLMEKMELFNFCLLEPNAKKSEG